MRSGHLPILPNKQNCQGSLPVAPAFRLMWLLTWLALSFPLILIYFLGVLSVCGGYRKAWCARALWLSWILLGSHTWTQQLPGRKKQKGGAVLNKDRAVPSQSKENMPCPVRMGKSLLKLSPGLPSADHPPTIVRLQTST